MGFSLNGKDIKELYYGNVKLSEAWLNGQKVYMNAPLASVINYMFRDIDENGNLSQATGELEDASDITEIGDYGLACVFRECKSVTGNPSFHNLTRVGVFGLYYAFYECTGITGNVEFPNLNYIGSNGLSYAFYGCTGLTGSISFPNLETVSTKGLYYAFKDCTGITEVHFKSSLSSNTQCKASNMGCTNATVYFDLP